MEKKRGRPADERDLQKGFSIRLPRPHDRVMRRISRRTGVPIAELVREAVAQYVEKD